MPSNCKQANERVFGSKFVTVCMTGDKDNQITMQSYQASNQCMAPVTDNILVPTKDAPELAFIVESKGEGEAKYIPGFFYPGLQPGSPLAPSSRSNPTAPCPRRSRRLFSPCSPRPGQQRPRAERPQLCSYRVHRDQEGCDQ